MFVRETKVRGKPYLSIVEKVKDEKGHWKVHYIAGLGYVSDLETVYDNPKKFFKELIQKILTANDLEDSDEVPFKNKNSTKNLGSIYIKWILNNLELEEFFNEIQKGLDISYNLHSFFVFLFIPRLSHLLQLRKLSLR